MGDNRNSYGMQLAEQVGSGVVGTAMGLALGGIERKQQVKQQRRLQNLQIEGQKEMGIFNREQALQMWKDTNYGAQMAEMKKAGLNPAMMYGMSGGGGTTAGAGQGSVSGGSAGGDSGAGAMGLQLAGQMRLIKAQAENIEADTENKKAQTVNTGADTKLKGLEAEYQNKTMEDRITLIENSVSQEIQDLFMKEKQGDIMANVVDDEVKRIKAEAVGVVLRNEAITKGMQVSDAQITKWVAEVEQGWRRLSLDERNTKVNELMGEFNRSMSKEGLGAIVNLINIILRR